MKPPTVYWAGGRYSDILQKAWWLVKEVDWWAERDERRRRDVWKDALAEKNLKQSEAKMKKNQRGFLCPLSQMNWSSGL